GLAMHCPVQVWPLQTPVIGSHLQLGSLAGQAQAASGGGVPSPASGHLQLGSPAGQVQAAMGLPGVLPVLPPLVPGSLLPVPPGVVTGVELQPQPSHEMLQAWPAGQSESTLQPLLMLGTQMP